MGFFDILTRMEETLEKSKRTETLSNAVKRVGSLFLVMGLIYGAVMAAFFPLAVVIVPIAAVIGGLLFFLILQAFIYIGARWAGGKGTFGQQCGLFSLILWPSIVVTVGLYLLFFALLFIPLVGALFGLVVFLPIIIGVQFLVFYFWVAFLKTTHSLSTFDAAKAFAVSIGLFILLVAIVAVIIGASFLPTLLGPSINPGLIGG